MAQKEKFAPIFTAPCGLIMFNDEWGNLISLPFSPLCFRRFSPIGASDNGRRINHKQDERCRGIKVDFVWIIKFSSSNAKDGNNNVFEGQIVVVEARKIF